MMYLFKKWSSRLIYSFIVNPLLLWGVAPHRGVLVKLYRWVLHNRDAAIPLSHPLGSLTQLPQYDNTYALSRAMLAWLWVQLPKWNPRLVIEMGSGRSTAVYALYASTCQPPPRIISIEQDKNWKQQTQELLQTMKLDQHVQLHHASTLDRPGKLGRAFAYDLQEIPLAQLTAETGIDLLMIDGPCGSQGREGTLLQMAEFLNEGAHIFFDDAGRDYESQTLEFWQNQFGNSLQFHGILPFGNGVAWMEWKDHRLSKPM